MPQVSLNEYAASIAQLIHSGSVDSAIAHCRYILSHYPKYLPAYRLLARACLDKGDLAHASHFYQCVLSVDPEDADAWMNLALLSDDLGELEQAIWLMERAFDVVPGNAQVRNHLRQLYARRDGVDRARIKLSRGALARLYVVGGFYRQAIEELRELLQAGTDLPPLHVAQLEVTLAKALWRSPGMAPMADQVCHSLTSKFPNCIQGNLIMAQIRTSAGKDADAEPYLALVRAVDPEGIYAFDLLGDQSPLPRASVEIAYLESEVQPVAAEQIQTTAPAGDDTSWLDGVGEAIEASPESVLPIGRDVEPPAWLWDWSADQAAVSPTVTAAPSAESEPEAGAEEERIATEWPSQGITLAQVPEAEVAEPVAEEDLPDWLRELGTETTLDREQLMPLEPLDEAQRGLDVETGIKLSEGAAVPSAARIEEAGTTEPEQELPEWLQELAAISPPEVESQPETGVEQAISATAREELPDWLAELSTDVRSDELHPPATDTGVVAQVTAQPEPVDRLVEPSPEVQAEEPIVSFTPDEAPAERVAEEELPDWLRELRSAEGEKGLASAEEQVTEPATEEELPAWLQDLEPEASLEEEVGPTLIGVPPETSVDLEPPDWLQNLGSQEPAAEAILPGDEEVTPPLDAEAEPVSWREEPDLWTAVTEQPEPTAITDSALEPMTEEVLPDWLQELRTEGIVEELVAPPDEQMEQEPTLEEEIPVWLRELSPEAEPEELVETATALESATERVAEEELPDWLRELRSEGVVEELVSPEEQVAIEPVAEDELPAWLQELGPETLEEEGEPTVVGEVPVLPVGLEEPAEQEGSERLLDQVEGETPQVVGTADWVTEQETPLSHVLEPLEGLPAWLSELEAEIAGLPASRAEVSELPGTSGVTGLGEQQPAESAAEQIGEEWTEAEEAISEEPVAIEPLTTDVLEPVVPLEAETPMVISEVPPVLTGTPEWLTELEQELGEHAATSAYESEELTLAEAEEGVSTEEAWLGELVEPTADIGTIPEDAERAMTLQEQPDWLGVPLDGQISEVTVEEMPDWLRQLHAAEPLVEQVEVGQVSPAAQDLSQVPTVEELSSLPELSQPPATEKEEEQFAPALGLLRSKEGPTAEPSVEAPQALRYLMEPGVAQDDYQARIAMARAYARAGNLDASTAEYEQLAKVPAVSDILVKDLETLVASNPEHQALRRVLGDAYLRAGRLQDALNAYKEALIRL